MARTHAHRLLSITLLLALAVALPSAAPTGQPATGSTADTIAGAKNYHRVDAVFACGGAVTDEALAELQRLGFRSVLNVREASEQGANVEAEGEAVGRLGMTYVHIPFNSKAPTTEAVDEFLAALDDTANLPMYIHCGTGNRAAALWMVKRALRDGWPTEKAREEATALGMRYESLAEFMTHYIEQRRK